MPKLSSAALTVWSTFLDHCEQEVTKTEICAVAAALRAVADQVVPDDYDPPRGVFYPEKAAFVNGKCARNEDIRCTILAIAAELEGAHDDPS